MVRHAQVAELVDDHVVEDVERRQHETPVEGERSARRARAPAGPLVADLDPPVGDPEGLGLLVDEHRHELSRPAARLVLDDGAFVEPQAWHLLGALARDPAAVRLEDAVDFLLVDPGRDGESRRLAPRDRQRPAASAARTADLDGLVHRDDGSRATGGTAAPFSSRASLNAG